MFKEEYKKLELEIIEFEAEDIIVTSPGTDSETPSEGWG